MNRLVYPSEDFPHPSPFVLSVPDDWLAFHVPGTLLAAGSPDDETRFAPNVTVSWQRGSSATDASTVAEALVAGAGGPARLVGVDLEPQFDGSVAAVEITSASDDAPITQRAVIVVGPPTSSRTRDVFQVVGSNAAERAEDGAQIEEILGSFSLVEIGTIAALA